MNEGERFDRIEHALRVIAHNQQNVLDAVLAICDELEVDGQPTGPIASYENVRPGSMTLTELCDMFPGYDVDELRMYNEGS